jgi:hypothetical protein
MTSETINCYTSVQILDQVSSFLDNKEESIFDLDGLIVVQLQIIKLVDSIKNHSPKSNNQI